MTNSASLCVTHLLLGRCSSLTAHVFLNAHKKVTVESPAIKQQSRCRGVMKGGEDRQHDLQVMKLFAC